MGFPIARPAGMQISGNGSSCGGYQNPTAIVSNSSCGALPGPAQTNLGNAGCFQQGLANPGCGGASYGCNGCNAQAPGMSSCGGCQGCQGSPAMGSPGCGSTFPASGLTNVSTPGSLQQGGFQQGVISATTDVSAQGQDLSLDSAALLAYQEMQLQTPAGQESQATALVAVAQEVAPADMDAEIKAFITRFSLDEDLEKRTKEVLKHRGDKWHADLKELTSCLTRARSPVGFLTVKLNNLEKIIQAETGVNLNSNREFCANFRRGHCTRGDSCRYSHEVATGAQRQANVSSLIEEARKAAEFAASNTEANQGGFGTARRVLKKSKAKRSSSSSRSRSRSRKRSRSRGRKRSRSRSRSRRRR